MNKNTCGKMRQEDCETAVKTFTEWIGDGKPTEVAEEQTEVGNKPTEVETTPVDDGAYCCRAVCDAALGVSEWLVVSG